MKYAGGGCNHQTDFHGKVGELTDIRLDICIAHLGFLLRLMLQPLF